MTATITYTELLTLPLDLKGSQMRMSGASVRRGEWSWVSPGDLRSFLALVDVEGVRLWS
jgi:hypothetical protein